MRNYSQRRARSIFLLTALVLVAAGIGIGWGIGQYRKNRETAPPPHLSPAPGGEGARSEGVASKRGELLFQTSCANCHGPDGRGDGISAATLTPPPRDFSARPWRFEPTKESIRRVILSGIPGTAMPASQGTLAEADVDLLVQHVYELATSRPLIEYEPSPDEKLLQSAGFVDLQGTDPPPLSVSDVMGRVMKLTDMKGKTVIINFWSTTCIHCLKDMPGLRKLEGEYASRGLAILYVCADADNPKDAQAILDKHAPGTTGLTEPTGLGLVRFEVQALPSAWLIGPDGKAIGRTTGSVDWHSPDLLKLIDRWLPKDRK